MMGIPRLKAKRKARLACRFTTGAIRVEPDGRHVTLPRLGTVRSHEPTTKLLTRFRAGTARIIAATVRYEHGRWFVAFQVETIREIARVARPDAVVGVDLGVKHLAVLADSTGMVRYEPNPNHLDGVLKLLRFHSRRVSRRQVPDRSIGRGGRAGGATLPHQRQQEAGDRRQDTEALRFGDTVTNLFGRNAEIAERRCKTVPQQRIP
ncbi:transposase [Streptomyces sp. DG1A-41]|uniref:transposase n=1 Tax=Streptomyces sp. DG1A-41 TaxID=3125779 RepID=UPI0030D29398